MGNGLGPTARSNQCVKMTKYLFNIWQFNAMKIFTLAYNICQSRFKILKKLI